MELLGHADIRTTLNIYTHVPGALTRDAVEQIGAALSA
jgi:site-specific recombinase XerD